MGIFSRLKKKIRKDHLSGSDTSAFPGHTSAPSGSRTSNLPDRNTSDTHALSNDDSDALPYTDASIPPEGATTIAQSPDPMDRYPPPHVLSHFRGAERFVLTRPVIQHIHYVTSGGDDHNERNEQTESYESTFQGSSGVVMNRSRFASITNSSQTVTQSDRRFCPKDAPLQPPLHAPFYGSSRFVLEYPLIQRICIYSGGTGVAQSQTTFPDQTPLDTLLWAPFYGTERFVVINPIIQDLRCMIDGDERRISLSRLSPAWPRKLQLSYRSGQLSVEGSPEPSPDWSGLGDLVYGSDGLVVERTPGAGPDWSPLNGLFYGSDRLVVESGRSNASFPAHFDSIDIPELALLRQCSLVGAGLKSTARLPYPRCHPGTQADLITNVTIWMIDRWNPEHSMLWLSGPAGVGKSAIAQTMGEFAEWYDCLGASIFFSRRRKVDDPSLFVTSIAYQLALRHPPYKDQVISVIDEDPGILTTSDRRMQFKKLLTEPLMALKGEFLDKLVIVVDGLDECQGATEQQEIIRLITDVMKGSDPPPFLWMICSRSEDHLKELSRDDDLSRICWQLPLSPKEPGIRKDVERYLTEELERIARRYRGGPGPDRTWSATKDELDKLVGRASGLFVVASSMVRFIGDSAVGDPASQLRIVVNIIDGAAPARDSDNFLAPVDELYSGVLERVESDDLPTTLRLLGACAVCPPTPALYFANLLGITQEQFYTALRLLHAFLLVPDPASAYREPLQFVHASFPDFLARAPRSKQFFQNPDVCRSQLAEACFHALNFTTITYPHSLSWLPSDLQQDEDSTILPESPLSVSYDILSFAATNAWLLCTEIQDPRGSELLKAVASFDFRQLQPFADVIPVEPFLRFIQWLYILGENVAELKGLVRTNRLFDTDQQFLGKCKSVSEPLALKSGHKVGGLEKPPRYVLAGFNASAIAVLVIPETVIMYTIVDIDTL